MLSVTGLSFAPKTPTSVVSITRSWQRQSAKRACRYAAATLKLTVSQLKMCKCCWHAFSFSWELETCWSCHVRFEELQYSNDLFAICFLCNIKKRNISVWQNFNTVSTHFSLHLLPRQPEPAPPCGLRSGRSAPEGLCLQPAVVSTWVRTAVQVRQAWIHEGCFQCYGGWV